MTKWRAADDGYAPSRQTLAKNRHGNGLLRPWKSFWVFAAKELAQNDGGHALWQSQRLPVRQQSIDPIRAFPDVFQEQDWLGRVVCMLFQARVQSEGISGGSYKTRQDFRVATNKRPDNLGRCFASLR